MNYAMLYGKVSSLRKKEVAIRHRFQVAGFRFNLQLATCND
jgi:hypothetical protein